MIICHAHTVDARGSEKNTNNKGCIVFTQIYSRMKNVTISQHYYRYKLYIYCEINTSENT